MPHAREYAHCPAPEPEWLDHRKWLSPSLHGADQTTPNQTCDPCGADQLWGNWRYPLANRGVERL